MTAGELKKILADLRDDMPIAVCGEQGVSISGSEREWNCVNDIVSAIPWWIKDSQTMNLNKLGGGSGGMLQCIKWTKTDGATEYLLMLYDAGE